MDFILFFGVFKLYSWNCVLNTVEDDKKDPGGTDGTPSRYNTFGGTEEWEEEDYDFHILRDGRLNRLVGAYMPEGRATAEGRNALVDASTLCREEGDTGKKELSLVLARDAEEASNSSGLDLTRRGTVETLGTRAVLKLPAQNERQDGHVP